MAPRRPSKNRTSAAVVYDPTAHREFVTGFRRRKQERRAQATKDIAANEKQARRDERKQKRAILKRTADRARGLVAESSDDDDEEDDNVDGANGSGRGVLARGVKRKRAGDEGKSERVAKVYDGANDAVVTTTVAPMQTYADAHFASRLPKVRAAAAPKASKSHGKEQPSGTAEGAAAPEVAFEAAVARKRTRSAAKKLSKMHNHSRIQKIRRERRSNKAS